MTMNSIVSFRLCTLSDIELIKKVDKHVDNIYTTGKIPSRNIPARPEEDFDLLVGELLLRYKKIIEKPTPKNTCDNCVYCWHKYFVNKKGHQKIKRYCTPQGQKVVSKTGWCERHRSK